MQAISATSSLHQRSVGPRTLAAWSYIMQIERVGKFSRRFASAPENRPVSPHIGFYQSFGRPVAKVFLGAVFTYQCVYFLWAKLETVEIQAQKKAEIAALESKLREISATSLKSQ